MAEVWDPLVELKETHTGTLSAGTSWLTTGYEVPVDEVIEIMSVNITPPVNATTNILRKLYMELLIDNKPYETLHLTSYTNPAEDPKIAGYGYDFGIPYLHRPITGVIPSPIEGTCPKAVPGQRVQVKVTALEDIPESFTVEMRFARVKGARKLVEVVGAGAISPSFMLDNDVYTKPAVHISLETFNELPGGLAQSKPQILPWVTYTTNKVATTPNRWYEFVYPGGVENTWQELQWNLVTKAEAYLLQRLAVAPHANSKSTRVYIEGRITNPEFTTSTVENLYYPLRDVDNTVNPTLKLPGLKKLPYPVLFHGVKGGVQHLDNGTSIPAGGVRLDAVGVKFVLK